MTFPCGGPLVCSNPAAAVLEPAPTWDEFLVTDSKIQSAWKDYKTTTPKMEAVRNGFN